MSSKEIYLREKTNLLCRSSRSVHLTSVLVTEIRTAQCQCSAKLRDAMPRADLDTDGTRRVRVCFGQNHNVAVDARAEMNATGGDEAICRVSRYHHTSYSRDTTGTLTTWQYAAPGEFVDLLLTLTVRGSELR